MGKKKRLKRADRTYKDLKQKQKAKIADCMFEKTCDYYREHDKLSEREDSEKIAEQIYQRVKGIAEKASFDEVYRLYLYRLPRYETRIAENGRASGKEREKERRCGQAENQEKGHEQKDMPKLWKEDETAVYRVTAL